MQAYEEKEMIREHRSEDPLGMWCRAHKWFTQMVVRRRWWKRWTGSISHIPRSHRAQRQALQGARRRCDASADEFFHQRRIPCPAPSSLGPDVLSVSDMADDIPRQHECRAELRRQRGETSPCVPREEAVHGDEGRHQPVDAHRRNMGTAWSTPPEGSIGLPPVTMGVPLAAVSG